jgi:hypothetical protein
MCGTNGPGSAGDRSRYLPLRRRFTAFAFFPIVVRVALAAFFFTFLFLTRD